MTTITLIGRGIIIDGHAGNPVVCHGISAISQMVSGYVQENDWGDVDILDGHLEIRNVKDKYIGNDLFKAMLVAMKDIEGQYPDCVKVVYA